MSKPYMEIWRITLGPQKGRYRVKVYRPDGYLRLVTVGVYRSLWLARWLGKKDAQKVLARPTLQVVGSTGIFIERIYL